MKFYFYDRHGENRRELTMDEVHSHLSESQIEEGIEAKKMDPLEQVSFMTVGGFIEIEF